MQAWGCDWPWGEDGPLFGCLGDVGQVQLSLDFLGGVGVKVAAMEGRGEGCQSPAGDSSLEGPWVCRFR